MEEAVKGVGAAVLLGLAERLCLRGGNVARANACLLYTSALSASADDLGHAGGKVFPQIQDLQTAGADDSYCQCVHLQGI